MTRRKFPPMTDAEDAAITRAAETDSDIWLRQNKTRQRLRISASGRLGELIEQMKLPPTISGKVRSLALVVNESGQRLTQSALDGRFEKARLAAIAKAIEAKRVELVPEIQAFQFRDLRAKAGTDKEEVAGMAAAKDQLGHADEQMTRRYVRHRKGKLVMPTK